MPPLPWSSFSPPFSALEDAEIALNRVGVDVATHIFTGTVAGEVVVSEFAGEAAILACFVGIDSRLAGDVLPQGLSYSPEIGQ